MKQGNYSNSMEISLTFDDGPDPHGTPRILAALERARASVTFFVVTPLARRYPALISKMREAGHEIEFHCVEHVRHTQRTRAEVEKDNRIGLRDLNALGITPRLWRTPWGIKAPWTEEIAESFGLEIVPWTADTHDWRGDSAAKMLEAVEPLLQPDAIVLLHDGLGPGSRRTSCDETAALIGPLVRHIRSLGYEPAPVKPAGKIPA